MSVVKFSDLIELPLDGDVKRVYGEAYETADGTTVIPVARIRKGRGGRRAEGDDQVLSEQARFGFGARPLGVFVVRGGRASWVPAVDNNRIALIGAVTGLLAAVIGSLAVLRQPPWPVMTITANK